MCKAIWATGVAVAALAVGGAAQAQSGPPFSGIVVFGDSLSDTGNVATLQNLPELNSYTTNPGPVAVEVIGSHYGLTAAPSLKGGSNSAYGGAGVINNSFGTPASIPTLTAQINSYLAANPVLDPDGLYVYFGGGNDVNFAATSVVIAGATPASLTTALANMKAAADQAANSVKQLHDAGARNVVVFNTPDVGKTPQAQSLNAVIPGMPTNITNMAKAYNDELNVKLAGRTGVIPVNAFLFLDEVVADPAAMGFTDVTNTACTTSSALNCTTSTLRAANADQTWLFADGIHPTTAGHRALGNLVLSEIAAPQQISLLAEVPLGAIASHRAVTGSALEAAGEGSSVFGRITYNGSSYDAQGDALQTDADGFGATVGGVFSLPGTARMGVAAMLSRTDSDFGSTGGGFETDAIIFSAFARTNFATHGYVQAEAFVADLDYNKINRIIDFGGATRQETGDTGGDGKGASLGGGWWFGDEAFTHGPFVSAVYQQVNVDGYGEAGARSTAMTFGDQERHSFITEIGYAIRGHVEHVGLQMAPYASVAYAAEQKDDQRYVRGGLVTMNGTFLMPAFAPSDSWVSLSAGVDVQVTQNIGASFAYSGRVSGEADDQHVVMVGLRAGF